MKVIELFTGEQVFVDDADHDELKKFKWHLSRNGYAVNNFGRYMHRIIAQPKISQSIDHINQDRLDNQRANLRCCSHAENDRNRKRPSTNTSGYVGVSLNRQKTKWRAQVQHIHLGEFPTAKVAALIYNKHAQALYGEFARLNFI